MNPDQKKVWDILEGGKIWTAKVEVDPNNPEECILVFPPDLLERAGWEEGDIIMCSILPEGRIILSKQ